MSVLRHGTELLCGN